jgi:hypothetical protein
MINDWMITFDDGSTATYSNMTATQAVNCAVNDWYPAKRVIAWVHCEVDVFSLALD